MYFSVTLNLLTMWLFKPAYSDLSHPCLQISWKLPFNFTFHSHEPQLSWNITQPGNNSECTLVSTNLPTKLLASCQYWLWTLLILKSKKHTHNKLIDATHLWLHRVYPIYYYKFTCWPTWWTAIVIKQM